MPSYISNSLARFQHKPSKPTHTPYHITYSNSSVPYQNESQKDISPHLNTKRTKTILQTIGCLLYYASALDDTLLVALYTISQTQAKSTVTTKKLCYHLLDYCATHPNYCLRYHVSNMILHVDSDASFLVAPEAKSRITGYFHLPQKTKSNNNEPILIECLTLKNVVTSAAECETAGVFHNAQTAITIQYILKEIGYLQPAFPLSMDNNTAEKLKKISITQKKSKSWDMKYYWLREPHIKNRFNFQWK